MDLVKFSVYVEIARIIIYIITASVLYVVVNRIISNSRSKIAFDIDNEMMKIKYNEDDIMKHLKWLIERYATRYQLYILEAKEKYGQLRITMANANKAVNDICEKYEFISQNVCYFCGRPHTFMTDTGWILPICPECYERERWGMKPYSEAICEEDNRIPYTYQIHHTNKDNDWYEDVDISETVIKIEENYDKHGRSIWRF